VAEIIEAVKSAGWFFHSDAVQAAGKLKVDVKKTPADYLCLSAHKIYGPKGIAAIYRSRECQITPLICGSQEQGLRGGTEAVASIIGFGVAALVAKEEHDSRAGSVELLRQQLESGLRREFPRGRINGIGAERLPNTTSITFPGCDADALALILAQRGLLVSTGSACKSSAQTPSHVLLAMGVSYEDASSTIRISLSHLNAPDEIAALIQGLEEAVPLASG